MTTRTTRWFATFLLLLIPAQMSFAAVHEYFGHRLNADRTESALFHAHGHDHDGDAQASDALPHHGAADDGRGAADSHEGGFGHIHPGLALLVSTPFAVMGEPPGGVKNAEPAPHPSIPPRRLDRPPLRTRP